MALEKYAAELLCLLKQKQVEMGSFLMLGRQNLRLQARDMDRIERLAGFSVADLMDGNPDGIYAESFLDRLGFSEIQSMDFSDYEGATIVHDLNEPIPQDLENRFDVVFDGGTLEHLFDFPRAIRNAMQMVREGGFYVACTPSSGFNGHGFYQFSPELFFRLFDETNGYRVMLLVQGESALRGKMYSVLDPAEAKARTGLNSAKPTFSIVAAQRLDASCKILESCPIQVSYETAWASSHERGAEAASGARSNGLKEAVKRLIPASLLEWRNIVAIERRNRSLSRSNLTRIESLDEAWSR